MSEETTEQRAADRKARSTRYYVAKIYNRAVDLDNALHDARKNGVEAPDGNPKATIDWAKEILGIRWGDYDGMNETDIEPLTEEKGRKIRKELTEAG